MGKGMRREHPSEYQSEWNVCESRRLLGWGLCLRDLVLALLKPIRLALKTQDETQQPKILVVLWNPPQANLKQITNPWKVLLYL